MRYLSQEKLIYPESGLLSNFKADSSVAMPRRLQEEESELT